MADAGDNHETCGPWSSYNEAGSSKDDIVSALNVIIEDGVVRRRRGRVIIGSPLAALSLPITGIVEHVETDGSRVLLIGGHSTDGRRAAFGRFDDSNCAFIDLGLPDPASPLLSPGFVGVSYKGNTIIADPFGRMLHYDGSKLVELVAYAGTDAGVPGARTYLANPPGATLLAVWRNRVVAVLRYTVGMSASSNDAMLSPLAPAGGASTWPGSTNFDALVGTGDHVTGAAICYDRLVLPTRRGLIEADEDATSPIPRTRDIMNGCLAPRSVQTCSDSVIYLGDKVICRWDGSKTTVLSGPVSETLKHLHPHAAKNAVAVNYTKRKEYRIWIPVLERPELRVMLTYDYKSDRWQPPAAGWYPYDLASREAVNHPFNVTAATTALTASHVEMLLTGDAGGNLWLEDEGETDAGSIFPAYFQIGPLGTAERIETWGDWRAEVELDGAFLQGLSIIHGTNLEQEIVRLLDGAAPESETFATRARSDVAAGSRATHATYSEATAWGVSPNTSKTGRKKVGSFRDRSARLQPALMLPGYSGAQIDPTPGGIRALEIQRRERQGGRRGGD